MLLRINLSDLPDVTIHSEVVIKDHDLEGIDGYWRVISVGEIYANIWRVGNLGATDSERESWHERYVSGREIPRVKCQAVGTVTPPKQTE